MSQPIQFKTAIPNSIGCLLLRRGSPRKEQLPRTQAMWIIRGLLLIPLVLACFGLSPAVRAVVPAPDGGYPGFNTAEGQNALFSLTTGTFNTAIGGQALKSDTTGGSNTAVGVNALVFTTTGSKNTAVGQGALGTNTTASFNGAVGFQALGKNTTGSGNTANGFQALFNNTTGGTNSATGYRALFNNTTGPFNHAIGAFALSANTTGFGNNAFGDGALSSNVTGSSNTAIGDLAGLSVTGSGNVNIGAGVSTPGGVDNETRNRNIATTPLNTGMFVEVDANGKLGFITSSRRYKHDIEPMGNASEALFALKPVTFRYNGDIDPAHVKMFGLIAEEVAKVSPDLAVRNANGEVDAIRFDSINAMLLNEFLKEHRRVEELKSAVAKQEALIAQQQKGMELLAASLKEQAVQIQKVSARLGVSKPGPKVVANQ